MNILTVLKNVGLTLFYISGAGSIVFLLSNYLGQIWAKRIYLEDKLKYDKMFQEYKDKNQKEIEDYKRIIRELEQKHNDRWDLKKQACLDALDIADAALSNRSDNTKPIIKCNTDTVKARRCLNMLACTCDNLDVIVNYMRAIGCYDDTTFAVIDDLRISIRKELGFGDQINLDKDKSYIFYLQGDNRNPFPIPHKGQATIKPA